MEAVEFQGDDRFEILRRLGSGAAGVVYEARDRRRGGRVALKVLHERAPDALYRFKNEFRMLADVSHPNLVAFRELVTSDERWMLSMELVDGVDFRRRAGGTDMATVRELLTQLVAGVIALHRRGMVHRDIKPSNVLVTREDRVVLLDFGLVAELRADGEDETIEGAAMYVAPECIVGAPATEASDWYAVGVMLYEALTGWAPFSGDTYDVLFAKETGEPPPPSALAPVPDDLDDLCVRLLRRDPGLRPGATELARRFGIDDAPTPADVGTDLIGRARHYSELRDAWNAVLSGRSVGVVVRGDSGMGKTTLVRRFSADARSSDQATVLQSRCFERESVPFKAIDGLVDALTRLLIALPRNEMAGLLPTHLPALARLFPVLRKLEPATDAAPPPDDAPDPQETRRRAGVALRELLTRLAERGPLIVHIDDAQWADADSAVMVAELARPPDAPALLLLLGIREDDADDSPLIRALRAGTQMDSRTDVRDLTVGPLSPTECRELAGELLGDALDREQAAVVAWEAGGSPLFVHELVRYARSGAGLTTANGRSITLEEVLAARIGRLDPDCRTLLGGVAVAGAPIRLAAVRRAVGLSPDRAESALARLRAEQLVRSRGGEDDRVELYHTRIADAVAERLSEDQLAHVHRGLARTLEALDDVRPEALATHWERAGEPLRAAGYARAAADGAARILAFARAADLYRRGLELGAPSGAERYATTVKLGEALGFAGHQPGAAAAYADAADLAPDPVEATELRRRAAGHLLQSGRIDEGLDVLRRVLDEAGMRMPASPRSALAWLLARRARLRLRGYRYRLRTSSNIPPDQLVRLDVCLSAASGLGMVDTVRGLAFHSRAVLTALRVGEPSRLCRAFAGEAMYLATAGGRGDARTSGVVARAQDLAEELDDPYARGLAHMAAGFRAYLTGKWRTAADSCRLAVKLLRDHCIGAHWESSSARHLFLWSLAYQGRVGDLLARLAPALRDAERRGDLYTATNLRNGLLNLAWLARDDTDSAREQLAAANREWSARGFHLQHLNQLTARANLALYEGRPEAANELVADTWPALERSLMLRTQQLRIEALDLRGRAALAAAAAGAPERDRLVARASRDAVRIRRERMPWSEPLADVLDAGLAGLRQRSDDSAELLARAADRFDAADMALHAAVCRHRRADLVGGDEGRSLREQAARYVAQQNLPSWAPWLTLLAPALDRA